MTRPRAIGLVALMALAGACPAPRDTIPLIPVNPRAAGRLSAILDEGTRPSRVHPMIDGEQLGGPNAIGRPGDLILENDQIAVVIDQLGSSAGFAESGGNIVDAADAALRKDELGQAFVYFGKFPRQAVYDTLTSGSSADGSAWVEASGRELYEPALRVTTLYTLRPPDRALLIETAVQNTGRSVIQLPGLGDAVQWGGAEKVAPGKARGFDGPSSGPYVGGVGRFTSYALAPTEGDVDATSGASWTDTVQRKNVTLGPGEKATYSRIFLVGARADTSSLVSELALAAGQNVGDVDVTLQSDEGSDAVTIPPDARLSVRGPSGAEALTIHAAGDPPRLSAQLPPGHWGLAYAGGGGRAGARTAEIEIAPDTRTVARLVVTPPAAARVTCTDAGSPAPCKITFERTDGGPAPDFAPAYVAGPARNQATTTADGVCDVPLAPGAYRVTASRGPEYTIAQAELSLVPGDRKELSLAPVRVVDTAGYLACDFHQHTMLGTDAPVSTRDRVIANVAESVEVAVASEHNVVADFEPIVRELGLARFMVSIAGDELTSDASRSPWGHANAWPLAVDPASARGGAPPVRDRTPREVFAALRRAQTQSIVVQINHPRSGATGYFDLMGFDRASGVGTAAGYDASFDALEVWNGRNVAARARVLDDFFALLRTSHPVTATADTDTHGIVGHEAGYPRTYVRVADDGPLDAWDEARTRDVVHGVKDLRDVVLTNGPMLRVTANGVPVGGIARGRAVDVRVHVESAPWVVVDEVSVLRASLPGGPALRKSVEPKIDGRGALVADVAFALRIQDDDAFVVVASGHRPMSPVLPAGASPDEITPWAMTGAIWVDADGDGHSLGR